VPYCHVVFTLPAPLSPLALQNPRVVYNLLFQAVAETLQTIARDAKHLGVDHILTYEPGGCPLRTVLEPARAS
jgi:hypothetical protein